MLIKPSGCIAVLRIRNEESLLERFLSHNECFFDGFIALLDRCTDRSGDIVRAHSKCISVIERFSGGFNEERDYRLLREAVAYWQHTWLWQLDVDELVSHAFLQEMQSLPDLAVLFAFRSLSLFPTEDWFIAANHRYAAGIVKGKLYRQIRDGCGTFRDMHLPYHEVDSLLYHFHMVDESRRLMRYTCYQENNPHVQSYEHIIDVAGARSLPIKDGGLWIPTQTALAAFLGRKKEEFTDQGCADVRLVVANLLGRQR